MDHISNGIIYSRANEAERNGEKLLLRSKKKNFTKKMKSISLLLYFLPFPFFFLCLLFFAFFYCILFSHKTRSVFRAIG